MVRRICNLFLISILFFVSDKISGQSKPVNGVIKDSDGEIVQFAYVFLNQDSTNSVFSDIDGRFTIYTRGDIQNLSIIHPEYQPFQLNSGISSSDSIEAILTPIESAKRVWTDNINSPTFKIINQAVLLENTNDPEQLGGSFEYTSYNIATVDLFQLRNHNIPDKYENRVENDTLFIKHHRIHGHEHMDVIESVNQRIFKYPNKNHERILALKHSGLENIGAAPLYSNEHPISFYNNYFDFLGIRFATPLGNRTYKHYEFHHEYSLPHKSDTVYVIHFRPSHLRVSGLEGTLYINSNNYAIQHVVARPVEHQLIDFQISQKFEFIQNKEWFPVQMNYVYLLRKSPKKYLGTVYDKKTYIKKIDLDPDLSKFDGTELCVCEVYGTEQSEEFWDIHRIEPLSQKRRKTYLRVDTLRHQSKPGIVIQRLVAFYRNKLTYKLPFMEVNNVFQLNRVEGARFGLQGSAGRDLLQFFEVGGYGAYGIRDKEWKWGFEAGLFLNKRHDFELKYQHSNDIFEPGSIDFLAKKPDFFRRIFTGRMDRYLSDKVTLNFRTPGYHLMELGFNKYSRKPLYDYQFQFDNEGTTTLSSDYNISEVSLRVRYAVNEKVTNTLGKVARLDSNYPVFYLNASKGFSNILNGELSFFKLAGHMDYKFHLGHIGTTSLKLEGGRMSSKAPYPILFNGRGGNLATSSIIIRNHFQTMGIYEFVSNKYFNVFFQHDFGSRLFAHSKFKPDIVIYQGMGWGDLDNKDLHSGADAVTKSYSRGFFETGLGLNNFLKFKLFGKVYGSLGFGYFHAYGPERRGGSIFDNSVIRLTYQIKLL
ncbi:MAG: DUF5686 family protein [bacterium]|nr:DUF5686 family protein [bacterium]